jgi:hypothetical protein
MISVHGFGNVQKLRATMPSAIQELSQSPSARRCLGVIACDAYVSRGRSSSRDPEGPLKVHTLRRDTNFNIDVMVVFGDIPP